MSFWRRLVGLEPTSPARNGAEIGGGPLVLAHKEPAAPEGLGARVLREGHAGEDVRWLQRHLGVPADGVFGPRTRAALASWQGDRGLVGDGVAGPATWRALGVSTTAPTVFAPPGTGFLPQGRVEQMRRFLLDEGVADAPGWTAVLLPHMEASAITFGPPAAAFMANVLHETVGLSLLEERLHYTTAARLMAVWPSRFPTEASAQPFLRNGPALAERVYGGRMGNREPGDGWRHRGRGPLMLTGRDNYERVARDLGMGVDELIEALGQRAPGVRACARWWERRGLSRVARVDGPAAARRIVNGGEVGMEDVLAIYARALPALAD